MIVASYNIQRGRGLDFVRRIERAVEVLRSVDADVIGLQEVVVEPEGPRGDQLRIIADALGMKSHFASARPHGLGDYGVAILSRTEIASVRTHDISVPRMERRVVLEAETEGVRVFVCHFGLGLRERRAQAEKLRTIESTATARSRGCTRTNVRPRIVRPTICRSSPTSTLTPMPGWHRDVPPESVTNAGKHG